MPRSTAARRRGPPGSGSPGAIAVVVVALAAACSPVDPIEPIAPISAPAQMGPASPVGPGSLREPAIEHESAIEEEQWTDEATRPDSVAVAALSAAASDGPLRWIHPLAGRRQLPGRPSRTFGAARDGQRPAECAAGHCGVDVGSERGSIVHAAAAGRVARIAHSPVGKAGRYVVIAHADGLETSYLHLDQIRADLDVGRELSAGEPIATLGRSGVVYSEPHLHFALARTTAGKRTYVNPEPLLRHATVLDAPGSLAVAGQTWTSLVVGASVPDDVLAPADTGPTEPGQDAAEPGDGRVRVTLIDAHTGQPVAATRIEARGPGNKRTSSVSDRAGVATLGGLAPGTWTVRANAGGYIATSEAVEVIEHHSLRFELSRGATLAGVVRDANGERVAGARVFVGAASARSDSAGQFRLTDAAVGRVTLEAEHQDRRGATELELAPGDEYVTLQIDVR